MWKELIFGKIESSVETVNPIKRMKMELYGEFMKTSNRKFTHLGFL